MPDSEPLRPMRIVSPSVEWLDGSPSTHQSICSPRADTASDDLLCAVVRGPFLVARDQQRDTAGVIRVAADESLQRRDHCRETRLHVRGAPAVKHAVANHRLERVRVPRRLVARRNDVRVTGEAEQRTVATAPRPQVRYVAERHVLAVKAQRRQFHGHHFLAARIVRRDRRTAYQPLEEFELGRLERRLCRQGRCSWRDDNGGGRGCRPQAFSPPSPAATRR